MSKRLIVALMLTSLASCSTIKDGLRSGRRGTYSCSCSSTGCSCSHCTGESTDCGCRATDAYPNTSVGEGRD
jgi:hypothetical protein